MMKIALILGTVRDNRDGNKVAAFAKKMITERGWTCELIDPSVYRLPMLQKTYAEMSEPDEMFQSVHRILNEADAIVLLAAEYNHSFPPAMKNILDHFFKEYFFKPSAVISYSGGPFGGIRATEQLRVVCAELKMPTIPTSLPISRVHDSLNDDGSSVNGDYERRSKKFFDELGWYMQTMKAGREKGTPY